ncbi:MAG: threonine synthase [Candidatus Aminicenantes bacterium]|nr:MAG: threonine synthase [Candidatus Aminicenantes bacterium]
MEAFECAFCKKIFPVDPFHTFCPDCQEPLLYKGPKADKKFHRDKDFPLEVMLDFLPLDHVDRNLSLGEGNTPLIKLKKVEKNFQLPSLYAKNETVNPTLSFKDRGTALATQKAISLGIERIGTVSTGNMAISTAAYGARAGLKTYVLIKEGAHPEIIHSTGIYNPVMINVKGDYGELFRRSLSLGKENNIYFTNSVDPFRIEGYKVAAFEIFFQLNQESPDFVFVPVSSGGHLIGLMKAFHELRQHGFITKLPHFIGVQAEGCSPIASAFRQKKPRVERIEKAKTIAKAISNPDPPAGNLLLRMIRNTGGTIMSAPEDKILEAQRILAEIEGIFVQPASATVLVGLLELAEQGKINPEGSIVLVLTGNGMKALGKITQKNTQILQANLADLSSILEFVPSD